MATTVHFTHPDPNYQAILYEINSLHLVPIFGMKPIDNALIEYILHIWGRPSSQGDPPKGVCAHTVRGGKLSLVTGH